MIQMITRCRLRMKALTGVMRKVMRKNLMLAMPSARLLPLYNRFVIATVAVLLTE